VDELMYSEKGNEVLLIKYLSRKAEHQRSQENVASPTA